MYKHYNISDITFSISELAIQSMLYEVSSYPSPGLVSPVSKGAHKDMDYYTFIDSTASLIKPMILCAEAGFSSKDCEDIFNDIRSIGIYAEEDMFKKTGGINTHKGMIFLMGICTAAAAKAVHDKENFSSIHHIIKQMTKGIVDKELKNIKSSQSKFSHGEYLYLKYNVLGIRGEVERGLPLVFNYSLELYEKNSMLSKNDRMIHTLIGIMQYCEDTTILYRHSIDMLNLVKDKAKIIMNMGAMNTKEGRRAIVELNEEFISKNISPGGSADLAAVTMFLYEVKRKFY